MAIVLKEVDKSNCINLFSILSFCLSLEEFLFLSMRNKTNGLFTRIIAVKSKHYNSHKQWQLKKKVSHGLWVKSTLGCRFQFQPKTKTKQKLLWKHACMYCHMETKNNKMMHIYVNIITSIYPGYVDYEGPHHLFRVLHVIDQTLQSWYLAWDSFEEILFSWCLITRPW